jgi:hypothetical protein
MLKLKGRIHWLCTAHGARRMILLLLSRCYPSLYIPAYKDGSQAVPHKSRRDRPSSNSEHFDPTFEDTHYERLLFR